MVQSPIQNAPELFACEPEGYYFDRKSARLDEKEVARHLSAFANASGGKLVIGVEDDGSITGFTRDRARPIEAFEAAAITGCEPSPQVISERVAVSNAEGKPDVVLALDVKASTDHVIKRRSDGAVFLRQSDRSVKLDHDQIVALEYDKNQRSFEEELVLRSSLADVDSEIMLRYKERLGTDAPAEQILRSRGFLEEGHLTKAGVILFAECPTRFLPGARVRFLRYDGVKRETGTRLNLVKDQTFEGPLPRVIEEVHNAVSAQLREFQFLDERGIFVAVPEYPEFAWLEGLVNAVTHRNYALSGDHIRISMYDDRLEIQSPGKLPNIVTLENMRHTRYSRNPGIARTLAEFGWVKELNEGVQRIYDEMQQFFLGEPKFSEPNDMSVLLTLENNIVARMQRQQDTMHGDIDEGILAGLNEYELFAMRYVYAHGKISTKVFVASSGKGSTLASKTLKGLAAKGLLAWHGSSQNDPSQFYALPR